MFQFWRWPSVGFPVKSILPMQTTFGQILQVLMGQKKNPWPFSPSMRFIIFHEHHYANLRGLVSFYFRNIKLVFFGRKPSGVQSLFLCTVFCGWYFFTGTFFKFPGVTCTFGFFFRKEIIFNAEKHCVCTCILHKIWKYCKIRIWIRIRPIL